MSEIVYAKVLPAPAKATIESFGSNEVAKLIRGGHNRSYIAGNVILKPAESEEDANWLAELFSKLPDSPHVRIARPIRAADGAWIRDGYVAWTFLEGEHAPGRHYAEKLKASLEFHRLLQGIAKPDFLDITDNSWTAATEIVLSGKFAYDAEFMELYRHIEPHLLPLPVDRQLIHGDLSGNFLCASGLSPAVIDFSPLWGPYGFGEGIMFGDSIVWEEASIQDLQPFREYPEVLNLAWYGILRRIAEQAEHIKWLGKAKELAAKEAQVFQKAIDVLTNFRSN